MLPGAQAGRSGDLDDREPLRRDLDPAADQHPGARLELPPRWPGEEPNHPHRSVLVASGEVWQAGCSAPARGERKRVDSR